MSPESIHGQAATPEAALDPDLPICDPHHHLWNHPGNPYLAQEFLRDTAGGHHVTHSIYIECGQMYREDGPEELRPIGETEFVRAVTDASTREQAERTAVAAGIVGFADLTLGPAVAGVLEAHVEAGKGRFRGIRPACAWDASPEVYNYRDTPQGMLLDRKFREGVALLQEFDLALDVWIYHPQLAELEDLAKAFPDLPIILNHIGTPIGVGPYGNEPGEVFDRWKDGMISLSHRTNVTVKLGGFGIRARGYRWDQRGRQPTSTTLAEVMAPYVDICVEHFGADRCMFESNFPVDKTSFSYTVLWNAFKRLCQGLTPNDRAALLRGTSMRVYRIGTGNVP